nr:MAG TPA: hypothetical protein [Caudoviricetes sp.]
MALYTIPSRMLAPDKLKLFYDVPVKNMLKIAIISDLSVNFDEKILYFDQNIDTLAHTNSPNKPKTTMYGFQRSDQTFG